MIDREQAKTIAQEELDKSNPEKDLLVLDEYIEFDEVWVSLIKQEN
jgi:hypothetical protein